MKEKILIIMAAGMGSRFGGFKQIEPVGPNKEFIIDYSVYDAKKAGFTKIVFVIKKELEEAFKSTIGKRVEDKIKVEYAYQELEDIPEEKKYLLEKRTKPWGTVHAILAAKPYVNGDFAVMNADDFYGYSTLEKASKFLDEKTSDNTCACITFEYAKTASKHGNVKRGVCFVENDTIVKLIESKIERKENGGICLPLNGDESFEIGLNHPVSMNLFAFHQSFFKYLDEYLIDYFKMEDEDILSQEILIPELVKEKIISNEIVLKNITSTSKWLGMTYREDLDEVKEEINKLIENGEYPNNLWSKEECIKLSRHKN